MKVIVFYEIKNKRLNVHEKRRKTIDYPAKLWLWVDDFKAIHDIVKERCCLSDDALVIRKIKIGQDEYMGCW